MKPKDYLCDGAISSNTTVCRDFAPSAVRRAEGMFTREQQQEHQAACTKAAQEGDLDTYYALNCKRLAHVQVPLGREAARRAAYGRSPVSIATRMGLDSVTPQYRMKDPAYNYDNRTQNEQSGNASFTRRKNYSANLNQINQIFDAISVQGTLTFLRPLPPEQKEALYKVKALADPDRFGKLIKVLRDRKSLTFFPPEDVKLSRAPARASEITKDLSMKVALGPLEQLELNKKISERAIAVRGVPGNYIVKKLGVGDKSVDVKNSFADVIKMLEEQKYDKSITDLLPYRLIRLKFARLWEDGARGKAYVEVGPRDRDGERDRPIFVKPAKMQHLFAKRAEAPSLERDYSQLRGLTTQELYQYLVGYSEIDEGQVPRTHRRRRGRSLPPLSSARENPVPLPSLIDANAYQDLGPGEYREIDNQYSVYRRDRKGQKAGNWRQQLVVVPTAQAKTWRDLAQRTKDRYDQAQTESSSLSQENPMASRFRHNPEDPLNALMAEFGPEARLGRSLSNVSPEFDEVYPATGGYGPYGLSQAPYGAREMLPTNRRNPRKKKGEPSRAKPGSWNADFVLLAERAREIRRKVMKDKDGRPCSLAEAFKIAREELGGDSFYTPKSKRVKPSQAAPTRSLDSDGAPDMAANNPRSEWNAKFGDVVRKAAIVQRARGCTLEEAFDRAFKELNNIPRRHPRGHWAKKAKSNPDVESLDDDMIRLAAPELVELSNRGYQAAAHELARRAAKNPRHR